VLEQGIESIVISRARDGMIVAATPGFCDMSGFDRAEVIGQTSVELEMWADSEQRARMLAELAQSGAVRDFDGDLRTKTGTLVRCRITAQQIGHEDEPHIFMVLRDVTSEYATERRLREAEQLYRTLVEQLPAATYVDEVDGTPLYASPQIERIYGCTPEEWMSDTTFWMRRVHPDDVADVDAWYDRHRKTGAELSYEYRLLMPSGEVRWVHDHVTSVLDEHGAQVATQGVMVDITEHKHAAEQLRVQDERLRELLEAMLRIGEQERQRIATELHDDTIQVMTAALLMLDRTRRSEAQETLDAACRTLREAIDRTAGSHSSCGRRCWSATASRPRCACCWSKPRRRRDGRRRCGSSAAATALASRTWSTARSRSWSPTRASTRTRCSSRSRSWRPMAGCAPRSPTTGSASSRPRRSIGP
jgi:PAS domain S-box-containing protein